MAKDRSHSPRDVVVVDAVRTPFLKSNGAFKGLMSWELGREAIKGLIGKTGLDPAAVDTVVMGTVVLIAIFTIVFNLIVDVIYAFVDPRVRYD